MIVLLALSIGIKGLLVSQVLLPAFLPVFICDPVGPIELLEPQTCQVTKSNLRVASGGHPRSHPNLSEK